jgi:hypothetical protein
MNKTKNEAKAKRVFGSQREPALFPHFDILDIYTYVARMGEGRGVHRVLVGKPEGKRPLGRPRCRWEDNI